MATSMVFEREATPVPRRDAWCIFHQPWWLEAVAPGAWGDVKVKRGGTVVARMPYVREKRFGLTVLSMPLLSVRLGPWIRPSVGGRIHRMVEEIECLERLIAQLPRFDLFRQCFTPEITNWLPFYWAGFEQTTRYTYRLDDLTDLDAVWANFHASTRRQIQKAARTVEVRTDLGVERTLQAVAKTFGRQGQPLPYSAELLRRIDAACQEQDCRRIFYAEDARGNTHAALYAVWDDQYVYSILAGGDPGLRNSGAGSLLYWRAIQFAAQQGKSFDFEGSMLRPVERHFRNYGARQVPYSQVTKMGHKMRLLSAGRDLWNAMRGKTSLR